MSQRKADPEIGRRAAEELERICKEKNASMLDMIQAIDGATYMVPCRWRKGEAPSAYYIHNLGLLGADVNYIIMGVRTNA